jgi:hypothetical protein
MPPTTLAELERRHPPSPAVNEFVGAAIDANGGPLPDELLRETLLDYQNGVTK